MANRTTRRDRRNATHGYSWTNPEKAAHDRLVAQRRIEWMWRTGQPFRWLSGVLSDLNGTFRSASDAIEGFWAALRGAFPQRFIAGIDQLDDDVEPIWDLSTDALVRPEPEEYTTYRRPDPNAPWIDAWGLTPGADR